MTIKKRLKQVRQIPQFRRWRQEEALLQRDCAPRTAVGNRIIASIALRIRQSLCLDEILSATVTEVQQFLACDRVLLYRLWSDGSGSVMDEAVVGGYPSVLGRTFGAEVFPSEYRELYRHGRMRAIDDVATGDVSPCLVEFLQEFEAKAKLVVPILQGEELWGLLVAHQCCQTRQWQQLEIDLLEQLATQIAIALLQAELYERVQAELLERQKAYSLLGATLDATADGILVANCRGKIISFNKRFADMWRIPDEVLAPRDNNQVLVFVQEQLKDPGKFIEKVRELHSQPNAQGHELLEFKDGRYFERFSQPQILEGKIVGRVWSFRDVTERHRAELIRREAHEQLESKVEERTIELKNTLSRLSQQALAFENIYDSVIITDLSGRIVDWNRSSERMFGYSKSEVLGKPLGIVQSNEDALALTQQVLEEIRTQDRWKGEIACVIRDGTLGVCESVVVPLYDSCNEMVATVAVTHDVTDRKRAEAEILSALEKEKELGSLKSRFISMASHEFRTPLASILISSDLLKVYGHKFSDEKKINQLNRIQIEVKHMTQLLDDVLLIGKASSGRLEFNPMSLELEPFCRELFSELELIDQQKHKFNFGCQVEYLKVEMDVKLLRQMLMNLISNAVKYSPAGGNVDVEIIRDSVQVIFKIRDSGIGIPESDIARLFEVFHRASNVGNISGTGLGLAIVKQAVDLHGGTIAVESEVGAGTTFTVRLPIRQGGE